MKKYIIPETVETKICHTSMLCSSDQTSPNLDGPLDEGPTGNGGTEMAPRRKVF